MLTLTYDPVFMGVSVDDPNLLKSLQKFLSVEDPDSPEGEVQYVEFFNPEQRVTLTGLLSTVTSWASTNGVEVVRRGWPGRDTWEVLSDVVEGITLDTYQVDAVKACLASERGVVEIATGGGKLEIAIALTNLLSCKTVYVVPTLAALREVYSRYESRGYTDRQLGELGEGIRDLDKPVVIACIASLYSGIKRSDSDVIDLLTSSNLLIEDEIHHLQAYSWCTVSAACRARYRFGFSGTPYKDNRSRNDVSYVHPYDSWLRGYLGDTLIYIPPRDLQEIGKLTTCRVIPFAAMGRRVFSDEWHSVYDLGVIENSARNDRIVNLASNLSDFGAQTLISVEKLEHGRIIQRALSTRRIAAVCSYGQGVLIIPEWLMERLPSGIEASPVPIEVEEGHGRRKTIRVEYEEGFVHIPADTRIKDLLLDGTIDLIIGSRIYDECLDIPCLTDLINAAGGKASQRFRQKVGRVLRLFSGKEVATIWDPYDTSHFFLRRHSDERLRIAREEGYDVVGTGSRVMVHGREVNVDFLLSCRIKEVERSLAYLCRRGIKGLAHGRDQG
jgi:hypothetical protein